MRKSRRLWEFSAKLLFLSQGGGENVKAENVDSHFHQHAGSISLWLVSFWSLWLSLEHNESFYEFCGAVKTSCEARGYSLISTSTTLRISTPRKYSWFMPRHPVTMYVSFHTEIENESWGFSGIKMGAVRLHCTCWNRASIGVFSIPSLLLRSFSRSFTKSLQLFNTCCPFSYINIFLPSCAPYTRMLLLHLR